MIAAGKRPEKSSHLPVAPTESTSASSGHPRHHGSRSEIDDGSKAQASTLLDEARKLAEAGDVAGCQDKSTEEHTSELPSLMRISYAVFCLTKKQHTTALHKHTR